MSITASVASKVINLFFVMIMGMVLRKTKVIDKHSTSALSAILVTITNPFLVISAFQKEYDAALVKNGFIILALSVGMHIITAVIGTFAFRMEKVRSKQKIYSFAMIFANCGFLGYPVLQSFLDKEGSSFSLGLFYGVFFTLFFNIFCWTYGVVLMNDGKGLDGKTLCRKIFLNPGFLSAIVGFALFMLQIKVPGVISEGMSYIGNMTFPLSMLIVGSLFCEPDLKSIFNDKVLYWYLALKLLVFPTVMIFVVKLCGLPNMFAYILITMCSMPAASNTAIMADYYDADRGLAAKTVSISTVCSVLTIPLMMILAENILGKM